MSSTATAAAADAKTTMGAEGRVGAIARQVIVAASEQGVLSTNDVYSFSGERGDGQFLTKRSIW